MPSPPLSVSLPPPPSSLLAVLVPMMVSELPVPMTFSIEVS